MAFWNSSISTWCKSINGTLRNTSMEKCGSLPYHNKCIPAAKKASDWSDGISQHITNDRVAFHDFSFEVDRRTWHPQESCCR